MMNDNYDVDEIEYEDISSRVQLWQFLFKLLLDESKSAIVAWCGPEGEFDIVQPDEVQI